MNGIYNGIDNGIVSGTYSSINSGIGGGLYNNDVNLNVSSIVTNGLILYLDATNRFSYPGSGTVWRDLSGNMNNGTLSNGPTFDTRVGGNIVFDGVNNNISNITNPTLTNQLTISVWCNMDPSNITGAFIVSSIIGRETNYRLIYSSNSVQWVIATTNNGWYTTGTFIGASVRNNTWFNAVAIYNGLTVLLYVNGLLRDTGGVVTGNLLSTTTFSIMGLTSSNMTFGKGQLSSVIMYNRALTSAEVMQNYLATKSKFNL
jgi:hypothetical protein